MHARCEGLPKRGSHWHCSWVSDLDRKIADITRSQHGAFNHPQAVAAGAARWQIKQRIDSGEWLALDIGVYALDAAAPTWRRQVMAAILSRPRAFASGKTAAVLHRLPSYRVDHPEITVPMTGNSRSRLARVRRRVDFSAIRTVTIDAIPTSAMAETLFDLASTVGSYRLGYLIDHALAHRQTTLTDLREVLDCITGSRLKGTVVFRDSIVELTDSHVPTESELEYLLLHTLDRPGIPRIDRQARLSWWERMPHRVDAVIEEWRLILEADGRAYHTKRDDFERDRQRDNLAAAHGYRVMRFTYRMLTNDPDEVVARVLSAGAHSPPH